MWLPFVIGVRVDSWRAIILAAGRGTRMKSSVPKVLQPICGREMVGLVADALCDADFHDLVAVVPPNSPNIGDVLGQHVALVEQAEPLGTAHALSQARTLLGDYQGDVLVINGDVPLITSDTLAALTRQHISTQAHVTLLTCSELAAGGMGRVIRDEDENVSAIVEEAELDARTVEVSEGNVGVYCFKSPWLWTALDELSPSARGEIYLTDLIATASAQGHKVEAMLLKDSVEGLGVNDGVQLARARDIVQRRINNKWLLKGVSVMEPAFIDGTVEMEPDTIIYPNTFLRGRTVIGKGCQIGPGSIIENSVIADGCRVLQSVIEGAVLEEGVEIGPYSHVRPESHIERDVHIGNFAEVKNSRLGKGTKVGHFSYVGDSWVGPNVNIGAGAVTCNFDGVDKHQTIIEEGAFIGSDSMLIAPVRIGAGASTGAGSVVTKDVPAGARVVGMPAKIISTPRKKQE
jgi:bifunctional UDP-N-acetylglucosamine pyrophosphorylase/glucosamine-1-phosphate N-acetyltransferase